MNTLMTPKDALTDLLLEFIEATVHEFLFIAGVYPNESFEQRALYDVPVHMNRYPVLCEYIRSMLAGCRSWIHAGEVEKLCVVVLSEKGATLETLVMETKWVLATAVRAAGDHDAAPSAAIAPDDVSQVLPLRAIEEAFRTTLVSFIAAPRPCTSESIHQHQPASFRMLVHTNEDVSRPEAALDESGAANAWVLASPFWHDSSDSEQQDTKQLLPIKSIQSNALPFTFQLYLETQ